MLGRHGGGGTSWICRVCAIQGELSRVGGADKLSGVRGDIAGLAWPIVGRGIEAADTAVSRGSVADDTTDSRSIVVANTATGQGIVAADTAAGQGIMAACTAADTAAAGQHC